MLHLSLKYQISNCVHKKFFFVFAWCQLAATKELFDNVEDFFNNNPKLTAEDRTLFNNIVKQIKQLANRVLKYDERDNLKRETVKLISHQKDQIKKATEDIFNLAAAQREAFVNPSRKNQPSPGGNN